MTDNNPFHLTGAGDWSPYYSSYLASATSALTATSGFPSPPVSYPIDASLVSVSAGSNSHVDNCPPIHGPDRANPASTYGTQITITSSPTESLSSTSTTGTGLSLKSTVDSMRFSQELALCDRLSELRQGLTCGPNGPAVVSTTNSAFNSTGTSTVAAVASLLPQSVSHSYTAAALLSSHAYYANSTSSAGTAYLNGPSVMAPSLLYPQLYPSQLGGGGQPTQHLLNNSNVLDRHHETNGSDDECPMSTDNDSNSDCDPQHRGVGSARSRANNTSAIDNVVSGNGHPHQQHHRHRQHVSTSRSSIFDRTVVHHSSHHSSHETNGSISGGGAAGAVTTSANSSNTTTTTTTSETLWRPY
ncbi:unnamed protein product [Oppiella nova]|uniref:Uncharacterized protein n=1 Tax=Oppiella nova TaxID=334625 RepID=A0A7R9QK00_9ACAR|nr:unnamed protein product [Oppiella nova]CAG2167227.1 unnamed protein product [Oppiella nova]